MKTKPIVSCIMPTTRKRAQWIPKAVEYFERQAIDAPIELCVVSEESVADIVREQSTGERQVSLHTCMSDFSIGKKRAFAHSVAQGQYLVPWDDDDWYSADRVRYLLEAIRGTMEGASFERCGSPRMMFWDLKPDALYLLDMTSDRRHRQRYVPTGGMIYTADMAARHPCPDVGRGYDGVWQAKLPTAMPLERCNTMLSIRHSGNTSAIDVEAPGWSLLTEVTAEDIIGDDAKWYRAMVAPPRRWGFKQKAAASEAERVLKDLT